VNNYLFLYNKAFAADRKKPRPLKSNVILKKNERCIMKKLMTFVTFFFVGLLIVSSTFAQASTKTRGQNMTISQNKQVVLRLFGEVFNQQSLSVIDELYDPNVIDHSAFPDQAPGVEGIKSAIKGFFGIFSNLKITVEDVIAEDDKVVTREVWRGTLRTSGKAAEGSVIHIFRIHDGKIADEWSRGWDWLEKL
jgi:predicted ester cyclase